MGNATALSVACGESEFGRWAKEFSTASTGGHMLVTIALAQDRALELASKGNRRSPRAQQREFCCKGNLRSGALLLHLCL